MKNTQNNICKKIFCFPSNKLKHLNKNKIKFSKDNQPFIVASALSHLFLINLLFLFGGYVKGVFFFSALI
jgi:hypothetical protein